ncbi:MAG TPA: NAD(P)H-hydrate dehydratase [Tissierellales bacterium]|nr:NAD(P)H-hydrate dehydratase [Tissierellales bacterium]
MIISTGIDIVKINRIKRILAEKDQQFLNKVFTEEEKKYISEKNKNPETIGGMFAAKEAISKVLGTGIGKISWKEIEILHNKKGRPYVRLQGEAMKVSKILSIGVVHLSISHERDFGIAIAIGENNHSKGLDIDKTKLEYFSKVLPERKKDSHKGTYGKVGIMAGSTGMTGACALSSMSALRCGSGLVYGIVPEELSTILSIKLTEIILKPISDKDKGYFIYDSIDEIKNNIKNLDVIALGPGIGTNKETIKVVHEMLRTIERPIVLDADGLNCVSQDPNIFLEREETTIITPHPGELSRLLKIPTKKIQENRIKYSKIISEKYNIITVLKGANTIVANGDGDIYINNTGNPGMATAGSGDVLTGMIASFLGQGIGALTAAKLGVYLHGLAGDLAKLEYGEYAMTATDILNYIPSSLKLIEGCY